MNRSEAARHAVNTYWARVRAGYVEHPSSAAQNPMGWAIAQARLAEKSTATHKGPACAGCQKDRWALFNIRGEWYCADCYEAAVERARTKNAVSRRVS